MPRSTPTQDRTALLAIASIIAIGGLIYELILGTASSYLFGDSVTSFSLGIGLSLFGMGIGSLISSRFFDKASMSFLWNELILSVLGGSSVILLFLAFSYTDLYWLVFVLLSVSIGVCIGLEIPLVMAMFRESRSKKASELLGRVLALDYMGALVGSLLFPFFLLPQFGLVRTSLIVALLNLGVVVLLIYRFRQQRFVPRFFNALTAIVLAALLMGTAYASWIEKALTTANFPDPVIYYRFTPYQRIVMTRHSDDTRLYLNNQLQFSSTDEARYHETLAHAALTSADDISNVLILGGGDGLLAREVLAYREVQNITLVDLDPAITEFASSNRTMLELNESALLDDRVTVRNEDAFQFMRGTDETFDAILVDLVDPSNERIAKLYSFEFYQYAAASLSQGGVVMTQASSSYFTPRAFWAIHNSMEQVWGDVTPMSANIPSFGEWGFVISKPADELFAARPLPNDLEIVTFDWLTRSTELSPETELEKHDEFSTLLRPVVYQLYGDDISKWSY